MWDEIMDFAAQVRPTHALTDSFKPATVVAAGVSVLGAIAADPLVTWSAAIGAVLTVLVPRLIDWYRSIRVAAREEDVADLRAHARAIEEEIRKRVELEGQCKLLKDETSQNRHRINDLMQTIEFMKSQHEALKHGVGTLKTKVRVLTTPDPDAPEPGTDEFDIHK